MVSGEDNVGAGQLKLLKCTEGYRESEELFVLGSVSSLDWRKTLRSHRNWAHVAQGWVVLEKEVGVGARGAISRVGRVSAQVVVEGRVMDIEGHRRGNQVFAAGESTVMRGVPKRLAQGTSGL